MRSEVTVLSLTHLAICIDEELDICPTCFREESVLVGKTIVSVDFAIMLVGREDFKQQTNRPNTLAWVCGDVQLSSCANSKHRYEK